MISFDSKEHWDKFGKIWADDPNNLIIDIRNCQTKEDYILTIGSVLRATYSADPIGNSLDSLLDVASDYYLENWLKWKNVYVVGWLGVIEKDPVLSNKLLDTLNAVYIRTIECVLRGIRFGDYTFEEAKMLEAMTDSRPHIFLILNGSDGRKYKPRTSQ